MRNLQKIQADLTRYDQEIADLLAKRMGCVEEELEYRKAHHLPMLEGIRSQFRPGKWRDVFLGIWKEEKKVRANMLACQNIALIGFMGAGKSTVSHYLQRKLGMEELETDEMVVEAEKMPITDIFAKFGEEYFRDCESRAILRLQDKQQAIISCGGGAVIRKENVENLKKSSCIVLLTASPLTILNRVKDSNTRPILNGNMNEEYIAGLMEKRRRLYEEAADVVIATDGKTIEEIGEELVEQVGWGRR